MTAHNDTIMWLFMVLLITTTFHTRNNAYRGLVPIVSRLDNQTYYVNDLEGKQECADILAKIRANITYVIQEMDRNEQLKHIKLYIDRMTSRFPYTELHENNKLKPDPTLTSYNVNKGEIIVFCMRKPNDLTQIYDIELLTYISLHEVAHIACPEPGHGPLFVSLFQDILDTALKCNVITKSDYKTNPQGYCGMTLNEHLV